MLHWRNWTAPRCTSPVLLLPVTLESDGPRSIPHLRSADEDAVINPALVLRMQEFGVTIPTFDDLEDESLDGLFGAVTGAVGDGAAGRSSQRSSSPHSRSIRRRCTGTSSTTRPPSPRTHSWRALATKNPAWFSITRGRRR
ncbi:DUF4011 domain-containing protein [Georgenia sp. SUBG003]|uniref:DUF4011 domain-containing protein n=1 Tax=Georgenia sp. SUBG003 TaxID=1497974 RepID=UPI003AB57D9F